MMRRLLAAPIAAVALFGGAALADTTLTVTTPPRVFTGLARADTVSVQMEAVGGTGPLSWSVTAGVLPSGLTLGAQGLVQGSLLGSGSFGFTVTVTDGPHTGHRSYTGAVYLVPRPKPIDIPYTLTAYYMPKPSWPGNQWSDIRLENEKNGIKATNGQRYPLLGYYQGDSPEVLDWQIKMAVDRGITNFHFHDFWVEGVDAPVYATGIDAFLAARYKTSMTFSVNFNQCVLPATATTPARIRACFMDHVLPFWTTHYFNQANYLRIEGKPVIGIASPYTAFGTSAAPEVAAALAEADAYIAQHTPYPGAYWVTPDPGPQVPGQTISFAYVQAAGFDAVWPGYVLPHMWPAATAAFVFTLVELDNGNIMWPPGIPYAQAVSDADALHQQSFAQAGATGVKYIAALAPDFDFRHIFWSPEQTYFSGQNHLDYWQMVSALRARVDQNPAALPVSTNTNKRMVGVGPWNEEVESSTLEPGHSAFQHAGNGNGDPYFQATAIARLFGGPATYDAYLPPDYGRGFPVRSEWTFSTATGAGLDEWSTLASAGIALGSDDVLSVTAQAYTILQTPATIDTSAFQTARLLVRIDKGADRLQSVGLYTRGSSYSPDAHLFDHPQEPGGRFYSLGVLVPASAYQDLGHGFRLYTFPLAGQADWHGTVRVVEIRFVPCVPTPGPPPETCDDYALDGEMGFSVKRLWFE